jgi:hypothetical protein
VSSASAKAASTDKRVDSLEKSLKQIRDMLVDQLAITQQRPVEASTHTESPAPATPPQLVNPLATKKKKATPTPDLSALEALDAAESTRQAVHDSMVTFQGEGLDQFPTELPGDEYHNEEEEPHLYPQVNRQEFPIGKKPLSGSVRTADSRVPRSFVLWPQELGVYSDAANPPKYDELTLEQFVAGFIATSLVDKQANLVPRLNHLKEMVEDIQIRDWPRVKAYHKVFMQHIEQGTAVWGHSKDLKNNLKMRYIYMAPVIRASKSVNPDTPLDSPLKPKRPRKRGGKKAFTQDRADWEKATPCAAFNSSRGCAHDVSHEGHKHCCDFCKKTIHRIYNHSNQDCYKRQAQGGN